MSFDNLKKLLQDNQSERLAKEQKERSDKPRHTVYKGNRTIQQLGDQPIENSVVINNQSLAIGDVMLPLAKGNVLRRVDNTNGGALLGSDYRDALENDFDANGRRRGGAGDGLGRNGGLEPSDPSSTNRPRRRPSRFPPPFGCTPPPPTCFWSNDPIAPNGFQGYGSAVVNENGVPLYLYCTIGTSVPQNLNCGFLDPQRWKCQGGVCVPDPLGVYSSKAQCEAALIRPSFTGGQCVGTFYRLSVDIDIFVNGVFVRRFLDQIRDRFGPYYSVVADFDDIGETAGYRVVRGSDSSGLPVISEYVAISGNGSGTRSVLLAARLTALSGSDDCGNPNPTCPP